MNFKNDEVAKLYNERLEMIKTTVEHKEPKRVPIGTTMDACWPMSAKSVTLAQVENDMNLEKNTYKTVYEDIHLDVIKSFGSYTRNFKFYDILGKSFFILGADGVSPVFSGYNGTVMEAEDYDDFIKDPIKYLDEVFIPRKFDRLRQNYPKNKEVLKAAIQCHIDFNKRAAELARYATEDLGYPFAGSGFYLGAFDTLFDYLRGFEVTMGDMRRRPEQLEQAAMANADKFILKINRLDGPRHEDSFPWKYSALHAPHYMSPAQFGRFYWPSFKKAMMAIHDINTKVVLQLEGSWFKFADYLKELPNDLLILNELTSSEFIPMVEVLGDKITFMGGLPNHMLRYGKYDECVDRVKEVYDKCAPGGGFMFSPDDSLMIKSDVDYDLYCKVNEFAVEYGKY